MSDLMTTQPNQLAGYDAGAQALAAQSTALIQSRMVMAMQRPRDIDDFRARLMRECKRPGFAEIAMYSKPVGGKPIVGMSVRFAEAALRHLSNFHVYEETISDTVEQVTIRVTAMDLETNVTTSTEVRVGKTVERRSSKDRLVVGERTNANGDRVFIVACTDDELMTKTGSALSKARRNLILRLIPGDIVDDCKREIRETTTRADKSDPDAARKRLFDSFASVGVGPAKIKAYLGHDNSPSPAELSELRNIYAAINTGEASWAEVWEAQFPPERAEKAAKIDNLPDAPIGSIDPETGEVGQ